VERSEIRYASYGILRTVSSMNSTETVHVVDDDPAVRDSLLVLLGSAGFVVRTHESAQAFLALAPELRGCVLTDVRMPEIDGLELQQRLSECGAPLAVVVMTGQGDVPVAVRAMKAGAVDFLEKPFNDHELLDAVRRALEQSQQLRDTESAATAAAARLGALTPREREVFDLLVAGRPTKTIARELGASPRTIEVHRGRVFEKLQARSLPDLVRLMLAAEPRTGRRSPPQGPGAEHESQSDRGTPRGSGIQTKQQ
jgi:two-component system, LuxR family, response regulator FixJ